MRIVGCSNNLERIADTSHKCAFKANATQVNKALDSEIRRHMPLVLKFLDKFRKFSSETSDILITALGTAFVAPVFIAFNPFSKADENTKKYTALRQPVSAVLAVVTQAGILIPINKFIDKLANEGKLGEACYDKRVMQDKSYLTRILSKIYPKKDLAKEVEKTIEAQRQKAEDSILNNRTLFYGDKEMPKSKFRDIIDKSAARIRDEFDGEIKRYKEVKFKKQLDRALFYKRHGDVAKEVVEKLQTQIPLSATPKQAKKIIKDMIKEYKQVSDSKEIIDILKDLYARPNTTLIKNKLNSLSKKIDLIQQLSDEKQVYKHVLKDVAKCIHGIKDNRTIINRIIHILGKTNDANHSEMIDKIIKEAKNLKNRDLIQEIIENHVEQVGKRVKGYKRGINVVASLIMLPITCIALNWLYPRFMDIVFPNLSKQKAGKK